MPKYLIWILIIIAGNILHIYFLGLNEVLKVADSFAYLQMSYFLWQLSSEGFGSGWFWFLYSLPIALVNIFIWENFLAAKVVNIALFNISAYLLWGISKETLSRNYSYVTVWLFFLSPTLLHFNIHILSENIYIPLFLGLFLCTQNFISHFVEEKKLNPLKYSVTLWSLIALMYLTRAEAFIYIGSIWLIAIGLLWKKYLSFKQFFSLWVVFFLSFFIVISPYLIHLHSLTGEWWLTNKGASNLRQAELRWIQQMDDAWFEKAVAELTADHTNLIAWFAGWMQYSRPSIEWSLGNFIAKDPQGFSLRIAQNQKKLFSRNLPEIFLGKAPKLYYDSSQAWFYENIFFLIFCLIPLSVLIYWIYLISTERQVFFYSSLSFFVTAFIFFTLFFTLNRYFVIFLPLMLLVFCYALQNISQHFAKRWTFLCIILIFNFVSVSALSLKIYHSIESPKDEYYSIKQEAWRWLSNNYKKDSPLKIMERFPIVTYYSWAQYRWITPYEDNIQNIYHYALHNDLDILIVDTLDFQTYRPQLLQYLKKTPQGFSKLKEFNNTKNQKVILYSLEK